MTATTKRPPMTDAELRTHPKRISDLLPGHVVLATNGDRLRVTYSQRIRRNQHEVQFRNLTTGEVPRPQRLMGGAEVLCVDEVTATALCRRCNQPLDHDGYGEPVGGAHYGCAINEREMWSRR